MVNLWPRVCRWVGVLGLTLFALVAFTPLANALHRAMLGPTDEAPADAIVVLGAAVSPDGLLDDSSLRRTLQAVLLQRRGLAPLLLFLGTRNGAVVEAEVRASLARDLGLASTALLTEPRGLTTQQEAQRSAALLRPRGVRSILLVTGEYHMWRARRLFERVGFEVHPAPSREIAARSSEPGDRLYVARHVASEAAARVLYRLLGRV